MAWRKLSKNLYDVYIASKKDPNIDSSRLWDINDDFEFKIHEKVKIMQCVEANFEIVYDAIKVMISNQQCDELQLIIHYLKLLGLVYIEHNGKVLFKNLVFYKLEFYKLDETWNGSYDDNFIFVFERYTPNKKNNTLILSSIIGEKLDITEFLNELNFNVDIVIVDENINKEYNEYSKCKNIIYGSKPQ